MSSINTEFIKENTNEEFKYEICSLNGNCQARFFFYAEFE